MRKFHYAWVICFACVLLFLCNMGLCSNILTIYLPFIEADGVSGSMGSAILSVRCLSSFLSTFFVGAYYKRFSLRKGLLLASLTGVLAPLVFSVGGSIFVCYLGAVLAGIAYGLGCIIPVSLLVANWFRERRGLAIGIGSAGSGIATMLFSPMLTKVILNHSLRTAFLVQAGIMAVGAATVFLLVRDEPAEKGAEPYGRAGEPAAQKTGGEGVGLPRYAMWVLAFMMLLDGGSGLSFSGHLSVLARTCGYSPELAARAVSVFGLLLIVGKMSGGAIADRIGTKRCSALLTVIFALGCLLALRLDGTNAFWCFAMAVLLGFGASVYNVGPPLWAADFSEKEKYAKTLKWLQLFYNLGGIVFTVVPGMIADRTGEYRTSYLLFAGMMVLSLLILLWAYRLRRRLYKRERAGA